MGPGKIPRRLTNSAAQRLASRQKTTRTRFLLALRELDDAWVAAFPETGFSDVYFSRLFTELWLRADTAAANVAVAARAFRASDRPRKQGLHCGTGRALNAAVAERAPSMPY